MPIASGVCVDAVSLASPDLLCTGAYQLEIISTALQGSGNVQKRISKFGWQMIGIMLIKF